MKPRERAAPMPEQNPLTNPGWVGDIETFVLAVVGALIGLVTWVARLIYRQSASISALQADMAQHKVAFTDALNASLKDRRDLFAAAKDLQNGHHEIREILASKPTKEDLIRSEDRLIRAIEKAREG
jgi:hypothetical protein